MREGAPETHGNTGHGNLHTDPHPVISNPQAVCRTACFALRALDAVCRVSEDR